jgi:hypothetical protein
MSAFIEYEIEEGVSVLVEAKDEQAGGLVRAARKEGEPNIVKAENKFSAALEGVRRSAIAIKDKLEDLRADEVEVTFGLKTTGKVGAFAIAEAGIEANYTVKLKWSNKKDEKKPAKAEGKPAGSQP